MRWCCACAAMVLASCGQQPQPQPPADNQTAPAAPGPTTRAPAQSPAITNEAAPSDPTASVPEPRGPIDPKSVEAAGQVVQHYGALIEQGRWTEAARLWSDRASATAFASSLRNEPEAHLAIGILGEPQGAAGSIYVTMPVSFFGKNGKGRDYRRAAEIILRRVNDVPGSTEAQRRWHIERIDWKAAP